MPTVPFDIYAAAVCDLQVKKVLVHYHLKDSMGACDKIRPEGHDNGHSASWSSMQPTHESEDRMGDVKHIQTSESYLWMDHGFDVTAFDEWTIAFAGASLQEGDEGSGNVVLFGGDYSCEHCIVGYERLGHHTVASIQTKGVLTQGKVPMSPTQFHVFTLTQANGTMRLYQDSTMVEEIHSAAALPEFAYIGRQNPMLKSRSAPLAIHRVVLLHEAIEQCDIGAFVHEMKM